VHQTYRFRLVSRNATDVTLALQVVQTAPRQVAHLPGVPASAHIVLTKLTDTGTGTTTLRLGEPLPLSSTTHTTGSQVFAVTTQGQHGKLVQKIKVDLNLTRPAT
jgi:hypothetical protein